MYQPSAFKTRVQSIDILRGLIMIVMALDHVRDFLYNGASNNPLDPATTTPIFFFTRYITHLCAPNFAFLAGMAAYLSGLRKTKAQLSSFLVKRGLWLIVVEMVLVGLVLTFNPVYSVFLLQIIGAIGISMVILACLVRLPLPAIFIIAVCIILGHDLLDQAEAARNQQLGFWWALVHGKPTFINLTGILKGHAFFINYSFLSWAGILLMGYCFGKLFEPSYDPLKRRKILLSAGFGMIALFIIFRWINVYGNPFPWVQQKIGLQNFFAFMNVNKYPPSLDFTCITVGTALVVLSLIENIRNRFTDFARIYGRVPFFYYILHLLLIHIITVIVFYLSGFTAKDIASPLIYFRPPQLGFNLGIVYLLWIGIVLLLYPLCKWYNKYKETHSYWWLSYI
jgi:uncharacterized membrane protein